MEKKQFMELLQRAHLNKKEFAKIATIPYGTVNNWGLKRNGKIMVVPNWVKPFMHFYFKAKQLEYITDEICQKIQDVKKI